MSTLSELIEVAVSSGDLSKSSQKNIQLLLSGSSDSVVSEAIEELVEAKEWNELNDRFYKTLAFGTGGLRGRTVGRVVTKAEMGNGGPNDRPEFPCVGTASMNYFNVGRAVRGLIEDTKIHSPAADAGRKPKIVFAHDTRHFSRDFAELCAKIAVERGCDAFLFNEAVSTPQLSFAVRELRADAGVVLTASHNPSHDNGFKAYLADGGQLIEPAASRIISIVNGISNDAYDSLPSEEQGTITLLGEEMDQLYGERLKTLLLRPKLLEQGGAKVVYTNLHGTGGHMIVSMLKELGFDVQTVPEQDIQDGRFPTVVSPNPENAPALKMATDLADEINAEIVIGTDPDSDRMGVAVRNSLGEMQLLTGNQIGSLLAWYRTKTYFEMGVLTDSNRARAVLVKTLVTTEMQKAIADDFGVALVNTLTGFKYIAGKLRKYEETIPVEKKGDYRNLTDQESQLLRLEHSRFFIFGGEESYGYLGSDAIRDKDANGSAVMFAELAAFAKSEGKTITALLDELYLKYGYYLEEGKAIVMEGADGADKIAKLAKSYSEDPPKSLDGAQVSKVRDYASEDFEDSEGDELPKEKMLIVDLDDGRSFAVRPSGTEPKIKYYLFGKSEAGSSDLAEDKKRVRNSLSSLWTILEQDANQRVAN